MTTIKDIRERNHHIMGKMELFKNHAYAERTKKRTEAIDELAQKNMQMLNASSPSFLYRGEWYSTMDYRPRSGSNRAIHPDLLGRVSALLDEDDFMTQVQEIRVTEYIQSALHFSRHMDDLWKLIPSTAAAPIKMLNPEVINIGRPMAESEIEAFQEQHTAGLKAFKRLFLESLLLS